MDRASMVKRITKRMMEDAIQSIEDGDYEPVEFYITDWVGLNHKTLREVIDIYNACQWEDE